MNLSSQRWLRVVFFGTALVFGGVAVYVYAVRFFAWLESDAAVTAVLAAKVLHARSPIVGDWYYANGDVWGMAPQLLAVLPVAILGLGPASLLVAVVGGFVIECVVFVKLYRRLGGELWVAMFATMVTLMAWSSAHVAYEYIQLAYGFVTCLYVVVFTASARLVEGEARRWRFVALGLLVALIAVQNPMRGVVYVLVPVVAGCAWPWRTLAVRRRLAIAGVTIAGCVLAFVVYTWVLAPAISFSVPRGHLAFAVGGVAKNLATLGRGLLLLAGGGATSAVRALPGVVILAGALALVIREVFASRAFTALRFVSVVVLAQLGGVLVPLVIGNLLVDTESVRYLMPSLLATLGLAVLLAVRTLAEVGTLRARRLAVGWLVAVPVAALLAVPGARPPTPVRYVWPDAAELSTLADELVRRDLTHGFSNVLSANLLTLDSGGSAMTCPIYFRDIIMPQRWLTETSCFTATALPDRFYVVADQTEHDRKAIHATLPAESDKFSVGDTYEVYVYRTAATSLAWLDLPIADGDLATFPLRLPATHLQLLRAMARVEAGDIVATGEQGTVLYGPYIDLPKGHYTVTWTGNRIESAGQIGFTVTGGGGVLARTVTLTANELPKERSELVHLSFTIGRAKSGVEFVVASQSGGRIALHELVIERTP